MARVCWDGVQLHLSDSSSLLALSPPPALTSNCWAVLFASASSCHLSQISADERKGGSGGTIFETIKMQSLGQRVI